jgi:hypothetical protein
MQTKDALEYAVSNLHQFTATIPTTIVATQKFQDARSQIKFEKLWAQFWTFSLNHPEPDRSDQHQLDKFPEHNFHLKNKNSHKSKYYPSHPIQCC